MLRNAVSFAAVAFCLAGLVGPAAADPVRLDAENPLFRLLTAAPKERFAVAAELILEPEAISTEDIRQQVAVAPFKYLFRASKTAQAALDFVLLKRTGGAVAAKQGDIATQSPNVLIVSIAGLRPDFVGAYGYPRPTTPRLDRLASEGALFESVLSTSAWSLPGNGSLLTGLYPSRHGLESTGERRNVRVDREVTTLAETLSAAGYDTAALVADPDLDGFRGLADGFDAYVRQPLSAMEMATRARLWLEWHRFYVERGLEPERFFLFVQLADLDRTTAASPAYESIFPAQEDSARGRAVAEYEAKVRSIDDQLGVMLDALETYGMTANTAVFVVASHGRELGERGAYGPATSLFDEQLRVPMVIRLPGAVQGGQRVGGTASLLDVLPTTLAWTVSAVPTEIRGQNLAAVVRAPGESLPAAVAERDLFAELGPAEREWSRPFHERAVRSGGWKAIVRRTADGTNVRRLFHVAEDSAEVHDLAARDEHAARLAELEAKLRAHMAAAPLRQPTPVAAGSATPSSHGHDHGHPSAD